MVTTNKTKKTIIRLYRSIFWADNKPQRNKFNNDPQLDRIGLL